MKLSKAAIWLCHLISGIRSAGSATISTKLCNLHPVFDFGLRVSASVTMQFCLCLIPLFHVNQVRDICATNVLLCLTQVVSGHTFSRRASATFQEAPTSPMKNIQTSIFTGWSSEMPRTQPHRDLYSLRVCHDMDRSSRFGQWYRPDPPRSRVLDRSPPLSMRVSIGVKAA